MARGKLKVKHLTNSLGNIAQWCLNLHSALSQLNPEDTIQVPLSAVAKSNKGPVPLGIGCPPSLDELCEELCKKKDKKPKKAKKSQGKKKAKVRTKRAAR